MFSWRGVGRGMRRVLRVTFLCHCFLIGFEQRPKIGNRRCIDCRVEFDSIHPGANHRFKYIGNQRDGKGRS